MTDFLKAIETSYKGYRFRSRTEARWAVLFDALKIKWEYENEGFNLGEGGLYLPDFWLPRIGVFAEVKGKEFAVEEINLCRRLAKASGKAVAMLDGQPDVGRIYRAERPDGFLEDVKIGRSATSWTRAVEAALSARFEHGETPRQGRIVDAPDPQAPSDERQFKKFQRKRP